MGLAMRHAPHLTELALAVLITAGFAAPARAADPPCAPLFEHLLEPPIPVFGGGGAEVHPWYGGWEKPRPQLVDYDADGDLDLFVAEEDGQLRQFRNDGTPAAAQFVQLTDDFGGVHELRFARLADLDADGDFDILVEAPRIEVVIDDVPSERPGGFLYFNEGTTANPSFVNHSVHPGGYWLDDLGVPITFLNTSPDFTDLDRDGDLDLLFGDGGQGGFLILYRNVGTPQNPVFHLETRQYRDVAIVFGGCAPSLAPPVQRDTERHGYMLFEFADINGDGDEDLFVGDEFNTNIYLLNNTNTGAETSPFLECETDTYFPGAPEDYASYLLPAFGDLDDDGDLDALMGSGRLQQFRLGDVREHRNSPDRELRPGHHESAPRARSRPRVRSRVRRRRRRRGARSPRRTGRRPARDPLRQHRKRVVAGLRGRRVRAGQSAQCLVVCTGARRSGRGPGPRSLRRNLERGGALLAQQRRPAGSPLYVETTDATFGILPACLLRSAVDEWAVPRFFDDDSDGDLDLLIGSWNFSGASRLMFFRNDGTAQSHAFVLASSDFENLGVLGQNLAPAFGDADDDGDLDLFVGDFDGHIAYVRNLDAPAVKRFHVETRDLGGIDVGISSVPAVRDLDGDGDLDLVVGESGGGLNYFENISEPDRYDRLACEIPDGLEHRIFGSMAEPPDEDGIRGGTAGETGELSFAIANVYPSPSRGATWVTLTLPHAGRATIAIIDAQGRRVAILGNEPRAAGTHTLAWDGRTASGGIAAPGVYQAMVTFEGASRVRRFVRLR